MGEYTKSEEKLAWERIEEFIGSEFGDYSFKYEIKRDHDYDDGDKIAFEIEYVNPSDEKHSMQMYYNIKEKDLYICMYEDIYEMTREFDWQVKYFWMTVRW